MGYVEKTDVRKLMQDSKLIAEVAKAIGEDPETMDSLADDIADKLSDELGRTIQSCGRRSSRRRSPALISRRG